MKRISQKTILIVLICAVIQFLSALAATDTCDTYYDDSDHSYCALCTTDNYRVILPSYVICAELNTAETECSVNSTMSSDTFYLVTIPNTEEQICYSQSDYTGCTDFGEGTTELDSTASDYMIQLYENSFGCNTCDADSLYYKSVSYNSYLSSYERACTLTTHTTQTTCDFTDYYDTSTSTCKTCESLFPNCTSCTSSECILCAADHYYTTYKSQSLEDKGICLYKSCGLAGISAGTMNKGPDLDAGHTSCLYCSDIDNCQTCEFSEGAQVCLACKTGYYLSSNACTEQTELSSTEQVLNYYVTAFSGYDDLNSTYETAYNSSNGTHPLAPFLFMQQALSTIYTYAATVDQVNATIWLMKGNHHFFYCVDDLIPTYRSEVPYSYFCTNSTMTFSYQKTDNVKLSIRAFTCTLSNTLGYNKTYYTENGICVDGTSTKPRLYINGPMFYFNITKYGYFENIIFDGSNSLAYYYTDGLPYDGYSMWDYPLEYCSLTVPSTRIQAKIVLSNSSISSFPITFGCLDGYSGSTIPTSSTECKTEATTYQSTQRCSGEPYHEDFFTADSSSGFYYLRRKVLFNLYKFDKLSTANSDSAPEISIKNCLFYYFLRDYEALIYVENNNYYTTGSDYSGLVGQRGENRGAGIVIASSTFYDSRFCKGLIVFRQPGFIMDTKLLNFTHALTTSYSNRYASNSRIYISSSTFQNLNWATNVTHIAAVNTSYTNIKNLSGTVYNSLLVPQFYHFGAVLNIDGFQGIIEMKDSTVTKNFIYIPQIYLYNHSTSRGYGIDQYLVPSLNEYAMARCDKSIGYNTYFLADGYSFDSDIEQMFPKLERLSTIYISRNAGNMIFYNNKFTKNIGTFGGAVTINSPNWQLTDVKSYVIFYSCTFSNNMAYFSGNGLFIRQTKKYPDVTSQCAGVYLYGTEFSTNFGMKKHNGGGATIYCDVLTDKKDVDYIASSDYTSLFILLQSYGDLSEEVSDAIASSISYKLYAYKTTLESCTFSENYSGNKGLALYLRYQSSVIIDTCTFSYNIPTVQFYEGLTSPYYKYLARSTRCILFYDEDEICSSEFDYLQNCAADGYTIDYPISESTLRIEHCGEEMCLDENVLQQTTITSSDFYYNDIGPYFNREFTKARATAAYISNAQSLSITKSNFYNHEGGFSFYTNYTFKFMGKFMPTSYFTYANAPVVRIEVSSATPTDSTSFKFATTISSSTFYYNSNYQLLGQAKTLDVQPVYYGALIEYVSNMRSDNYLVTTLALTSNTFKDNVVKGPNLGLIYVKNGIITATSNTFSYNGYLSATLKSNTASSVMSASTDYFPQNSYSFNESMQYGAFYISIQNQLPSNYYNSFTSNSFSFTFAYEGSAYYINNLYSFPFVFSSNTYDNQFADRGSVIEARFSPPKNTSYQYFQFSSETITNQYNRYFGAFYFTQSNNQQAIRITDSTFKNCQAYYGSALASVEGGVIYCRGCVFNSSNKAYSNKTILIATKYASTKSILTYVYYTYLDLLQAMKLEKGTVYHFNSYSQISSTVQLNGVNITVFSGAMGKYQQLINCTFLNLNATSGSALYASGSNIYIANSKRNESLYQMYNNNASMGTILLANLSNLIMVNATVTSNTAVQGSGIYMTFSSVATISNSSFKSNIATKQATLYVADSSSLSCNYCNISYNKAYADSSVMYGVQTSASPGVQISNSYIHNNNAWANAFTMLFSSINITSTLFVDNISTNISHGFTSYNSIVKIDKCTITYTNPDVDLASTKCDYGFFNMNYRSDLYVKNSTLSNLRGNKAAAIYVQGDSNATIYGGTVIKNTYSLLGRTMSFVSANTIIFEEAVISDNLNQNIYGDSILLYLNKTTISGSQALVIRLINSYLYMNSSTIQDSSNVGYLGGGIYCSCYTMDIYNSTFKNLKSYYGGALFLVSYKTSIFTIYDSTFEYNNASRGGAVYIDSANQIQFKTNTFRNNSAAIYTDDYIGGAIFIQCPVYQRQWACNVTFEKKNTFTNNTSLSQGGAIAWVNKRFTDLDNTTVFTSNTAVYGNNISSYPKKVVLATFDSNDESESSRRRALQAVISDSYDVVSGTELTFKMILYDQEGGQMTSETKSVAFILPTDASSVKTISGNFAQASGGVYDFTNVELIVTPGSEISMYLKITGLTTYGNDISISNVPINFTFSTRACVAGEEYTQTYECVTCAAGSYSFIAPVTFSECIDCDANAICFGGSVVTPQNGYWRSKNTSENFIACPNADSCLAGNTTEPLGICAEGYQGILCSQCQQGYLQKGKFECGICDSKWILVVKLAFVFIVGIWLIYLIVKASLSSIEIQKPLFIVYMKIMLNHLHMIGIILSISFNWPSVVSTWMEAQKEASGFSNFAFSFECFLIGDKSDYSTDGQTYYLKLVLYAILPIIFALIVVVCWAIYCSLKKDWFDYKSLVVSTILIVFYIAHPSIAKMLLSSLNCMDIEGDQRLFADLSQICYENKHLSYAFGIGLPFIIGWIIVIPFFWLFTLVKNRQSILQIESQDVQSKSDKAEILRVRSYWGFLFNGFHLQYYYWEIIILFRKIILIIIMTFMQTLSTQAAILISIIILVINQLAQARIKPYYEPVLNSLEQYSMMSCMVTLYFGLFYLRAEGQSFVKMAGVKYFFFSCILLPNAAFYITWFFVTYIELLRDAVKSESFKVYSLLTCGFWPLEKFKKRYLPENDSIIKEISSADENDQGQQEGEDKSKSQIDDDQSREGAFNIKKILANINNDDYGKPKRKDDDFDNIIMNDNQLKGEQSQVQVTNQESSNQADNQNDEMFGDLPRRDGPRPPKDQSSNTFRTQSFTSHNDIVLEPKSGGQQSQRQQTNRKVYPLEKINLNLPQPLEELKDDKSEVSLEEVIDPEIERRRRKIALKKQRYQEDSEQQNNFDPQYSSGSSMDKVRIPIRDFGASKKFTERLFEEERKSEVEEDVPIQSEPPLDDNQEAEPQSKFRNDDRQQMRDGSFPSRNEQEFQSRSSFGSLKESKIQVGTAEHNNENLRIGLSDIMLSENIDQMLTPQNQQELDLGDVDKFSLNNKSSYEQSYFDSKTKQMKSFVNKKK